MAVFFSTEEVLDELFKDNDGEVSEEEEVLEEEDRERENLREHLAKYECGREFDREFFVDKSVEVVLPIVFQAASKTQSDAAHLCSSTLSAASILHTEGKLWLNSIQRRLAGRVSVRQPYYAEVHRNIPSEIFSEVTRLLQRSTSKQFQEPYCIIGKNRKGVVISFTCLCSLLKLFQLLTGMSTSQVRKYFIRVLKGVTRNGHKVKLIVSTNKDFAFVYKYHTGQLTIQFKYGEWNTFNMPKHPCQLDNQEL